MLHTKLRNQIVTDWLMSSPYELANSPEFAITYWFQKPNNLKRYIEIWIPIKKLAAK